MAKSYFLTARFPCVVPDGFRLEQDAHAFFQTQSLEEAVELRDLFEKHSLRKDERTILLGAAGLAVTSADPPAPIFAVADEERLDAEQLGQFCSDIELLEERSSLRDVADGRGCRPLPIDFRCRRYEEAKKLQIDVRNRLSRAGNQNHQSGAGQMPSMGEQDGAKPGSRGKEVPWDPGDKTFISAKEALKRVKEVRPAVDHSQLMRAIQKTSITFMRNPNKHARGPGSTQMRVHEHELHVYIECLKGATHSGQPRLRDNACQGTGTQPAGQDEDREIGYRAGYEQGYTDVKENKRTPCPPPESGDRHALAWSTGWKKGYAEGRVDSTGGMPQKHGGRA